MISELLQEIYYSFQSQTKLRDSIMTLYSTCPLDIDNCKFLNHVDWDAPVELKACTIKGNLNTTNYIKLWNTTVSNISTNSYVKLYNNCVVKAVEADSVTIKNNSSIGIINSHSFVKISHSKVYGYLLGETYINIHNSEVETIKSLHGNLSIQNSIIQGNAETSQGVKNCTDSIINGILKCHNFNLEISNSWIKVLILGVSSRLDMQTVTLYNSHVEHLFLENEGRIKLVGLATVGTIYDGFGKN